MEKTVAVHHRCVKQHYGELKAAALEQAPTPTQAAQQATITQAESRSRVVRARERFERVQALKAEGKSQGAIQRELRLAPMTVRRYYRAESVEELVAAPLAGWPSILDDYKPYLHQRWNAGCTNITQLFREIKAQGFPGGYTIVYAYLRQFAPAAAPPAVPPPPKVRHITSWIRRHPDNLAPDDQAELKEVLAACTHLSILHDHVKTFAEMMTGRHGDRLDGWIAAVRADDLPHLHTFAGGLERDYDAVRNGLTLPYSSGAVEGNVCRVKAIKRSRYGRAKLDLLRKIILCADRTDLHRE
ncbi:transposase [Spirillospora sp. CA-253888]